MSIFEENFIAARTRSKVLDIVPKYHIPKSLILEGCSVQLRTDPAGSGGFLEKQPGRGTCMKNLGMTLSPTWRLGMRGKRLMLL